MEVPVIDLVAEEKERAVPLRPAGVVLSLDPLPPENVEVEIEAAIDGMKQARYFDQAHYGIPVREAILEYALG